MDIDEVKKEVRKTYGSIAKKDNSRGCGCGCGSGISEKLGYAGEDLENVPEGADLGLGCGNPTAFASLRAGETVLDLGSGSGLDCFLAARQVGETGKVIGVDMTPEMIAKARANAEKGGYSNVEFRQGEIENMPVNDSEVDVIISNCVINLVPDKARAFSESFRVLKPGGRLMVSDIVLARPLPEWILKMKDAYSACVSGAELKENYLAKIREAGFTDIEIIKESAFTVDLMADRDEPQCGCGCDSRSFDLGDVAGTVRSISVSARKPL